MKVLVLGASGIIGQHMRLCVPSDVEPVWVRSVSDELHLGVDLTDYAATKELLEKEKPNAIINLAGESRPDVVQFLPQTSHRINIGLPEQLVLWCEENKRHYVHISTQAVYQGDRAPYNAYSNQGKPVNEYGIQKQQAERFVYNKATIVRPTFVLGIRPYQHLGRENPVEQILSGKYKYQVNDRFFSVAFARDVAEELWAIAKLTPEGQMFNFGLPISVSRYDLAERLGVSCTPVPHNFFKDIAPRPFNTTYTGPFDECSNYKLALGLEKCKTEYLTMVLNGK